MSKAISSKTKNTTKKKNPSGALKALQADQQSLSTITNKSLFSLKKVKNQLDDLISQRKTDHILLKKLKKNTSAVNKKIQQTETQLSKIARQSKPAQQPNTTIKKDLQQLKDKFTKKNTQFSKTNDKLENEISKLTLLVKRVDNKILSLKQESLTVKDSLTTKTELEKSVKKYKQLLTKVKQFEEQLKQFKDTYIAPDKELKDFARQLKKLRKLVKQSNTNYQEHDTQIKLLQSNVTNIKQLLQQDSDNAQAADKSHQHKLINSSDKKVADLSPAIDRLTKKYASLSDKTHSMADIIDELHKKSNSWKQDLNTRLSKQTQSALSSVQDIAQQISKQKQKFKQQFKYQKNQHKQNNQDLQDRISTLQEKNKKQTAPLKTHIRELKHEIETLQERYNKQQKDINTDSDQLSTLQNTINQFNEKLQQSHLQLEKDLKNQIQLIQDTDKSENLQQFHELKQKIAIQSQQIEDNKQQFSQLNTLFDASDANTEQLSEQLERLTSRHNELSDHEEILQTNVSALTEQINNEYSANKIHLEDIIIEQESQQDSFKQLNETLTKRSQLFLVGLAATIVISSIIFYYQDSDNNTSRNDLIIDKFNVRIEQLEQQNKEFSQHFNNLNDSVTVIKNQNEEQLLQYALQNSSQQSQAKPTSQAISQTENANWEEELELLATDLEENQDLLQYNLSLTQQEQENIKQTISELSIRIESMAAQLSHLQHSPLQTPEQNSAVIDINSISHPYYAIQLLGAQKQESVMKFIHQYNLLDNNQIIKTEYQNKPWYILVQGQYMSFTNAKKALGQLPEALLINNPWIKKLP